MQRSTRDYCERCARPVVALRPSPLWRLASVAALGVFAILVFAAGASGLGIAFVPVVVFCLGTLVLGPLNERASEPKRCPDCRCVIVPRSLAPAAELGAIAPAQGRKAA
jgi:hypothetical protein